MYADRVAPSVVCTAAPVRATPPGGVTSLAEGPRALAPGGGGGRRDGVRSAERPPGEGGPRPARRHARRRGPPAGRRRRPARRDLRRAGRGGVPGGLRGGGTRPGPVGDDVLARR